MLQLPSEITHAQASACLRTLSQALARQTDGVVEVDAGALQSFDSSALALLLELRRQALAAGRGFVVQGLAADMRKLAALYGVDGLLGAA